MPSVVPVGIFVALPDHYFGLIPSKASRLPSFVSFDNTDASSFICWSSNSLRTFL